MLRGVVSQGLQPAPELLEGSGGTLFVAVCDRCSNYWFLNVCKGILDPSSFCDTRSLGISSASSSELLLAFPAVSTEKVHLPR